jgi:hypothetical protein
MQLQPRALPFLLRKCLTRSHVELIITDSGVYCTDRTAAVTAAAAAAKPQLLQAVPAPKPGLLLQKPLRNLQQHMAALMTCPGLLQRKPAAGAAEAAAGGGEATLATGAEGGVCSGGSIPNLDAGTSDKQVMQRLETAYEAVKAALVWYGGRTDNMSSQSTAPVERDRVAAKLAEACAALSSQSLLVRSHAADVHRASRKAAMELAVETAKRLVVAVQKLKVLTAGASSRARETFQRLVASVIATRAAERFAAAFEALRAAAATRTSMSRSLSSALTKQLRGKAAYKAVKKLALKAAGGGACRASKLPAIKAARCERHCSSEHPAATVPDAAGAAAVATAAGMGVVEQ